MSAGTETTRATTPDWRKQVAGIVEMMRSISRESDPQVVAKAFGTKFRLMNKADGVVAISRRDLEPPKYRITRSSLWTQEVNPWRQREQLPLLEGGLLGSLLYAGEARIIDELRVEDDDPAAEHLAGFGSLAAIPQFDQGEAINMVAVLRKPTFGFVPEEFPEMVWMSSLIGRMTQTLVLSQQLKQAYQMLERELKVVEDIQRSLLPTTIPKIPRLDLAAHYQTSRYAGGDYYDFFPLPDGRWGILIADVSGHGTPAAVIMAITHSIAHAYPGHPTPPSEVLTYVNDRLVARYTGDSGDFVTAFYGIFDPAQRTLTYSCAGHNPPRLKRCVADTIESLDGAALMPLGISEGIRYEETMHRLIPGDQIIFYTDGITEATAPDGRMFGLEQLDRVLEDCRDDAQDLIQAVLTALDEFTAGRPAADDRTLIVARVS